MLGNAQENFNGLFCLFVWLGFFCASVDKNSSRNFLKGLFCYAIILIQACVYSESCRQLVIMSLVFILSISSLQNRNVTRQFHRLNSTKWSGIASKTFHWVSPNWCHKFRLFSWKVHLSTSKSMNIFSHANGISVSWKYFDRKVKMDWNIQ